MGRPTRQVRSRMAAPSGGAQALGLDARRFLAANDSYHFFEPLGDLLKTGPTGTNVMDVRLMLVGESSPRRRGVIKVAVHHTG